MSLNATVLTVMIASPGDMLDARATVRNAIVEWTSVNAEKTKVALIPIGWETNAFPSFGSHPQEIIDEQVTEKADFLIALFGSRIGQATPKYLSGTVQEVEKHAATGKPTLVYFSSVPVNPSEIDPSQLAGLAEYKKTLQGRCYYENYKSLEELKSKLKDQLSLCVEKFLKKSGSVEAAKPTSSSSSGTVEDSPDLRRLWKVIRELKDNVRDVMPSADLLPADTNAEYHRRHTVLNDLLHAAYGYWSDNSPFLPRNISKLCEETIDLASKVNRLNASNLRRMKQAKYFDNPHEDEIQKLCKAVRETVSKLELEISKLHGSGVTENVSLRYELSDKAKALLLAGARDPQGEIRLLKVQGSTALAGGGESFLENADAKTIAEYRAALEELYSQELIDVEDSGRGLTNFPLTQSGFELATFLTTPK